MASTLPGDPLAMGTSVIRSCKSDFLLVVNASGAAPSKTHTGRATLQPQSAESTSVPEE